jgi:subtilisin family serine protease
LGAGLAGLLTLGWPLSGALGDHWASLGVLLSTLAITLPEELVFRGAVWGLLSQARPGRQVLATLLSLLVYLVFIPTQVLPGGHWEALGMLLVLLPLALLTTQLRALTGSIWAGTLVAWLSRAMPLLFTDPRDEIMEPTQWLAGGAMLAGAAFLALLIWLGRRALARRWRLPGVVTLGLAALLALAAWGTWLGGWVLAGEPGFYDDGFLIVMKEQADLSPAYQIADPVARRAFVYQKLVQTAETTQAPVRASLEAQGLSYRPYYLINMLRVEGHHRLREEFAGLPGVAYVMLNPNVRPYPAHTALGTLPAPEGGGVEWNIRRAGAAAVWEMGYRGQGVVVGGQDTGYDWEHPALRGSYRGWDANTQRADHNYNWHDAWDDTSAPHDDGDHGTHTMGIVVGDDGQGNQIGMAPQARWMGCRNMRRGIGNPASYTECMEFFLAPYPLGGDPFHAGDVTRSPDVVNNSWGCPDYEGCQDETLKPALEALRVAGIMMVVSAGNDGPACQTTGEPPARYAAAFSVGATGASGSITFFSSRGPVPAPNGDKPLLKPDVVAPGDGIRSSVPGGDYRSASGTSMAGPHVTGLVALLWSARPDLRGDIEATQEIIRRSARPVPVSAVCSPPQQPPSNKLLAQIVAAMDAEVCACGGVSGTPNNVYGWGEIDALRAVQMALAGR